MGDRQTEIRISCDTWDTLSCGAVHRAALVRASAGYWQERKRAWLSLGIQSEKGRDDGMLSHMAALAAKSGGFLCASHNHFGWLLISSRSPCS